MVQMQGVPTEDSRVVLMMVRHRLAEGGQRSRWVIFNGLQRPIIRQHLLHIQIGLIVRNLFDIHFDIVVM